MGRKIVIAGLLFGLFGSYVLADALKSSLTNIMNTKEEPSMVDLGNINLAAKPKVKKTRSSDVVVATVNGNNVIKKDADNYLSQRTQGKVKDFDSLPNDQRLRLINELSLPILALDAANKELSDEEKLVVYSQVWMQTEGSKVKVTDDDVLQVYNQLKKQAEDSNATQPIPPYETIKNSLKAQIIEKTIVGKLLENATIKIY